MAAVATGPGIAFDDAQLDRQASQALVLLALVAGQEVGPDEGSDGTGGRWRIRGDSLIDRPLRTAKVLIPNEPLLSGRLRPGLSWERCINKLKTHRALATRYDKREYVCRGTVDVASIRIWIRDLAKDPSDTTYLLDPDETRAFVP